MTKVENITQTLFGTSVKIGERYKLVISNLQQANNNGTDYSGPVQLVFPAGIATDNTGNSSLAKTITVGIDDLQLATDTIAK